MKLEELVKDIPLEKYKQTKSQCELITTMDTKQIGTNYLKHIFWGTI